ncbi:MAG: hypothetical protein IT428_05225 [Planctomycetaceae bacterium]|nr:hypothetical protein [Planctomycetaceae bacterium]
MALPRTSVMMALWSLALACQPLMAADEKKSEGVVVDKDKKTISVPAKIALRKLPNLADIYPLEVVACHPHPKGKKAHETVVTIDVAPSEIHKAVESLGLKAGKPARGEDAVAAGPEVVLSLEIPGPGGTTRKLGVEKTMVDKKTGKTLPKLKWHFTGSASKKTDPDKPEIYAADDSGTLISIFPVTDETVFQSNLTLKDEKLIKLETNPKVLPEIGTAVKLLIEVP